MDERQVWTWDEEILKLVNSMLRPSGSKLPRQNMRCCSSSLQVALLWHWRRPKMDMSAREWEGELKGWQPESAVDYHVQSASVCEFALSLTNVEEATSEAMDTVDQVGGEKGSTLILLGFCHWKIRKKQVAAYGRYRLKSSTTKIIIPAK
eukprot:g31145.t1